MRSTKRVSVANTSFTNNSIDFEKLGHDTMLATRNREVTEQICGCKIDALRTALGSAVKAVETEIAQRRVGLAALCSDLYDRDNPVRDSSMFARQIGITILLFVVLAAAVASLGSHIVTFYLMGYYLLAWLLGPILTGLAVAAGYVLFERVLSAHQWLQTMAFAAIALLAIWGLVQWAETRAITATHANTAMTDASSTSYVDGAIQSQEEPTPAKSDETEAQEKMKQAWILFLLSADLLLGIGLAYYEKKRTDPDFVGWRKAKELTSQINRLEHERDCLLAMVEIAKRDCMAGILRALHTPKKKHSPYFRALPLILFCVLSSHEFLHAQKIERQEGILIDVSGSIGSGGSNNELFREYLHAVKQHLSSEPPSSRIFVCVITTDSFGSTRELLRGWTPEAHGVFTDELTRARRQLVANFEAKSSSLTPISSGTDIFGALWRMKAVMESGSKDEQVTREIWIWSDMMNETPTSNMPALLALGPDKMVEQAKANGLLVPLKGYKIHVSGASPRGLSPQSWNNIKAFWSGYFRDAGAELDTYSTSEM